MGIADTKTIKKCMPQADRMAPKRLRKGLYNVSITFPNSDSPEFLGKTLEVGARRLTY